MDSECNFWDGADLQTDAPTDASQPLPANNSPTFHHLWEGNEKLNGQITCVTQDPFRINQPQRNEI